MDEITISPAAAFPVVAAKRRADGHQGRWRNARSAPLRKYRGRVEPLTDEILISQKTVDAYNNDALVMLSPEDKPSTGDWREGRECGACARGLLPFWTRRKNLQPRPLKALREYD